MSLNKFFRTKPVESVNSLSIGQVNINHRNDTEQDSVHVDISLYQG